MANKSGNSTCILIGSQGPMLETFHQVINEFARLAVQSETSTIKVHLIDSFSEKTVEEILGEIYQFYPVDKIVIEPFVSNIFGVEDRTDMLKKIHAEFPQVQILATGYTIEYARKCLQKGADAFRAYHEINAQIIRRYLLAPPVPRPYLRPYRLRLLPRSYRIALIGKSEGRESDQITVSCSGPAMRLIYFLTLACVHGDADWIISPGDGQDYICKQPAIWEDLEEAIPRRPHGKIDKGIVDCEQLKGLPELINQPRKKRKANSGEPVSLRIGANTLSQTASLINEAYMRSCSHYDCQPLIIRSPAPGRVVYRLNPSVPVENIVFDFDNQ